MHSFDWDGLCLVLRLSRCRSLLAAERELGISHSTLSRRLAALEERFGEPLFERHGRGVTPTRVGTAIIEAAARMEEEAQRLDRQLLGEEAKLEGVLRVTAPEIIAARHAADFSAFAHSHPRIRLELVASNLPLDLGQREADVALRLADSPPQTLVGRKILRAEFALYAAKQLVEASTEAPELDQLPWLVWDARLRAHVTEKWMKKNVPHARVAGVFDHSLVLHRAVSAAMGVGFLSCVDGDEDSALVRLLPPEPEFGMDLWVLTHRDLRHTARVRTFMSFIAERIGRWRDRYAGVAGAASAGGVV